MILRPRRTLPAILTLLVAALIAGCASSSNSSSPTAATASGNVTDRAFVNDMTPHHKSAITMAQIALTRAQHPQIKQLAQNIIGAQNSELALMANFKKTLTAGNAKSTLGESMMAMGMNMNDSALKTAMPFDKAFIAMMSPHHAGAITMAKIELAKGSNPKVKALATRIIAAQTKEISEMKTWRTQWYGATSTTTNHTGTSRG
jgi:uncharacterized protein (DUF305 family)